VVAVNRHGEPLKKRVLIASIDSGEIAALAGELGPCFEVWVGDSPVLAEKYLRGMPDLVLAARALFGADADAWESFANGCELSGIRCILYGADGSVTRETLPWCGHFLPTISSPPLVREYLKALTQLDKITRQLEFSQEQLLSSRSEQEEGLRSATHIQQSLMPETFPTLPGINFARCFRPCQNVGGDLFNVLRLDENILGIYMLDVSGHGVPAAMVTVAVYQALSPHTGQIVKYPQDAPPYYCLSAPHEVLSQLDREYPFERFDAFFTISYMLFDQRTGVLRYANGAHPSPIILRLDGRLEFLDAEGTLIGLGGLVEFEQEQIRLFPGDRLFLYTDGLFEYENSLGEQFGLERMHQVLKRQRKNSLEEQCRNLLEALHEFGGEAPFEDDVSLLAMEFAPRV